VGSDEEGKVVQFHSRTLHAQASFSTHHPNVSSRHCPNCDYTNMASRIVRGAHPHPASAQIRKEKCGRCSLGTEHFRPRDACVLANSMCHRNSHYHRLVLHHHRLDRFVIFCPSSPRSSHSKYLTVRPPSPADATTAHRVDTRHSNVTHDMHNTLPAGPSLGTTYCWTWVLLCVESFRTPSYVPYPSFA